MSESGPATYRKDLYYINRSLGHTGLRSEQVVSGLRFWLTYLLTPWRWSKMRGFNVIRDGNF